MKQKLNIAMTLAVIFSMLFTTVGLADKVENDIVAVPASITLQAGVSSSYVYVQFYVQPTSNDDDLQCNFDSESEKVTFTINTPAGVVATPSSLTFNKCKDGGNFNAQTVRFSANASAVSGYISFTETSNNTGGTFNYSNAVFYVNVVSADTTPPVIIYTIAGTLGDNGWHVDDVFVDWTVTDPESAFTTVGCVDTTIDYDTTGVTLTCSATSTGGTSSESVTIKRDATAPSVTITPDRAPDYGDWYNASVNFTVAGTDATSGIASCDADFAYSSPDSESTSVTASCTDYAGNVGSTSYGFKYDGTAPTISYSIAPAPAASGWYNISTGAPTVTFTCSDVTAGIESCTLPYTFGEGAGQSYIGTAKDNAGNAASATVSGINVDLTAPTLTWDPGMYADGSVFYFGFVPALPPNPCVAADALSGPAGCAVTGYSAAIGTHILTATAYDVAGNSYSEQRTYEVKAWTLFGFYQPVDMNGVWNTVKGGSTVPLKFEIFAGPTELTSTAYVQSLQAYQVSCAGGGSEDPIETVATSSTSLRYDWTSGQFIYNWQTPKKPGTCYKVTMTTQDGSFLTAFFKLK